MTPHDHPPSEAELQGWIDDRLSGDAHVRVADYLARNPSAAARLARQREQNAALGIALRSRFPDEVPARFRIEVPARGAARRTAAAPWRSVAALIGVLLFGAVAGGGGVAVWTTAKSGPTLARDAFLAHAAFTVEKRHFVEVAASEPHLLPWLSNRLHKQVVAPDLRDIGYSLIGGRVVPTLEGLAAQLMYEDTGGARLTVYLRAEAREGDATPRFEVRDGANGASWSDSGIGYALVAPIDRDELLTAAKSIQEQVGS